MTKWKWRGNIALLGVALAFVLYPLVPNEDVINSDWPAFATGARLIVSDPSHLYDLKLQRRVESDVTGGRVLVTLGIGGILPFLAPAWVALLAVPFAVFGTDVGGRLWILFGLACLGAGFYLASPLHSWGGGAQRRRGWDVLPAFASVPTALMMLNAQLDGIVALGIGAAIALWSRPYLAGLALGLTLVKPQLVLPLAFGLLLTRRWLVLAGWATVGLVLLAATLALSPHWIFDWLGQTRSTIQAGAREINLPHFAIFLPAATRTYGLVALTIIGVGGALILAARRRNELTAGAAILVIGGVVASPHALPSDLVLVALGLAIWGRGTWKEWLALSVGALITALAPDPVPAGIGVALMWWLTLRISPFRRAPVPASAG